MDQSQKIPGVRLSQVNGALLWNNLRIVPDFVYGQSLLVQVDDSFELGHRKASNAAPRLVDHGSAFVSRERPLSGESDVCKGSGTVG